MTTLFIILGIIAYLIIGRVIINILDDNLLIDCEDAPEWYKGWGSIFFPLILIWIGIRELAEWISDKF